jgi:hypothetical protein
LRPRNTTPHPSTQHNTHHTLTTNAKKSNRYAANAAATGLHSYDEGAWRTQPAPDADEVIWKNLPMRQNTRVKRALLMGVAFVALLLLYLPLTAAIQVCVCVAM